MTGNLIREFGLYISFIMSYLRQFYPAEIALSTRTTRKVFVYFWPFQKDFFDQMDITLTDCAFAQALLVEACQRSLDMGYIERLWKAGNDATMARDFKELGSTFKEYIKGEIEVATCAIAQYIKGEDKPKAWESTEIYESIRTVLSNNFRVYIQERISLGDYEIYTLL